jgi:mycothiol synthase
VNPGGRAASSSLASAHVPALPALPDGFTARPLSLDDIPTVALLMAAAEVVDDTGEHWSSDDLHEFWLNDLVDLSQDGVVATTTDGEVVGWATAIAPPTFRGSFRIDLEGRVHPSWRGRGIGRALLAWQVERGTEVHAERHPDQPGQVAVLAFTTMTSLHALLRRAGFEQTRWYFHMQRPLTDLPEVPRLEGVDLVPFSWDRDEEVRRAHNAAFTEHHGSSERDEVSWRTWFTGQRAFRPDLSVLALADGAVVAYVLAYVHESDTTATGVRQAELGQIGVLPHARGRGLAKATIAAALRAAGGSDCQRAGLQVDSANVTGALRLYEALGFTTRRTLVAWSRDLPPVG